MCRLSFDGSKKKIRNPERHLRSLRKWAKKFESYYPERTASSYHKFKIWTFGRLIESPNSQLEWKKEVIFQLLRAAEYLKEAKPDNEQGKSWVAVLLSYPNLSSSEVTVFFDKEYLNGFIPSEQNETSLLKKFGISLPSNFTEAGYISKWDYIDEHGSAIECIEEQCTIYENT
ncbi:DUF3916 domain-containing protein [Vibrio profundum]|uniref:DUF3916 domain-containing protein n=1 Tax=Vibrio profundum TaxID=2910247 RepID=UPI003D1242A1